MIVLVVILRILLALLIIIAAALAVPVGVFVRYNGDIFLQVRYLFLKINIPLTEEQKEQAKQKKQKSLFRFIGKKKKADPEKERTNSDTDKHSAKNSDKKGEKKRTKTAADKRKSKKQKKKKENPALKWLRSLYKKGGVDAITEAFKKIASLAGNVLKPIFKNIRLRSLDIDITAASDNAADTAINYGKLCAGIYPALSVILNIVKYNDYTVNIRPDFDKKELEADISAEISLIPWVALAGALHALVRFIGFKVKGEL